MEKILKNLMETVVEKHLDELFPRLDCCKCQACKNDIMAIVLNKFPPKYVSTEKGEIISRISIEENQLSTKLTANILQAAEIVAKNPQHEKQL